MAIVEPIGTLVTGTTTTPQFDLGQKAFGDDGKIYMYVRCNASSTVAAGDVVRINQAYLIEGLTTTLAGAIPTRCGVSEIAFAINEYGWVVVEGPVSLNVLASCVADVILYTTATAGKLDDTATTKVSGIKINTTNGGSTALVAGWVLPSCGCNL